MPALTVQNAEITTATVEVKTLTISGKQVTLAVFRQLKEEDWLTESGEAVGPAWGTVNYHPDKCGDKLEHLHVVWQRASELRRAYLRRPYAEPYELSLGRLDDEARLCWYANRWATDPDRGFREGCRISPFASDGKSHVVIGGKRVSPWSGDDRKHVELHPTEQHCADLAVRVEEACAARMAEIEGRLDIVRRFARHWLEAVALPQLFIAV